VAGTAQQSLLLGGREQPAPESTPAVTLGDPKQFDVQPLPAGLGNESRNQLLFIPHAKDHWLKPRRNRMQAIVRA
jgi:hypothetical protein